MKYLHPPHIEQKLQQKLEDSTYRKLADKSHLIDFCSNDYLGFARSLFFQHKCNETFDRIVKDYTIKNINGSGGARLISGHTVFVDALEQQIARFHYGESALLFNSGYDANVGFFSAVPDRKDMILYDEYVHASARDGFKLSKAKAVSFKHNDLQSAEELLKKHSSKQHAVYLVLESVYSMDGDKVPLADFCILKNKFPNVFIVLDEAHSGGVIGEKGEGMAAHLGYEKEIFARIFTYGKAFGSHGASVVCSAILKDYLINYSRAFIFTTAAHFHSLISIKTAYDIMSVINNRRLHISYLSSLFKQKLQGSEVLLSNSVNTPIQAVILPGKDEVFAHSSYLESQGFYVKGIVFPTVPKGKERLRICFHYFNKKEEVEQLAFLISNSKKRAKNA